MLGLLMRLNGIQYSGVMLCWLVLPVPPAFAASERTPVSPFETQARAGLTNGIDGLVFRRLSELGLAPANPCSDAVFVRRLYLDVIGTLPTPKETAQFLASRTPNKRAALIETVLARDEFADYWAMKWSDVLRIKAEFPINLWPNAAQAYHRWVHAALRENLHYDQFVRAMLTSSGSNFRVPQVNFYRAMQNKDPQAIAQAVALTFMGVRAEKWPREKLTGMAGFFSALGYKQTDEWKEEIVFCDPASTNRVAHATFPDGQTVQFTPDSDPREVFANWLVNPANPWFSRNIANRLWSWLLGRGIIHEPDDIRPDNPPANPQLLAYLERELTEHKYDLKHLFRLILNSSTYQLSSIPSDDTPESAAQFAHYMPRRLDAEVLADALNQITGTAEQYTSAIPEPFTYIPRDKRSIALPDGSISSAFLELFGRPSRDTGLQEERNNRPTAAQSLHLLNSSHIQTKLEQSPKLQTLLDSKASPSEIAAGLYLMILSRYPTDAEMKTITAHAGSGSIKQRDAMIDLAWALINSTEFLFRH